MVNSQVAFARAASRASYSAVPNTSRRSSSSASAAVWPSQPLKRVSFEHQRVVIKEISSSLECAGDGNKDLEWPSHEMKDKARREAWGDWAPFEGLTGEVVHRWEPLHSDPRYRSNLEKPILLLKIEDKYLTILESNVTYLPEVDV